MRTPRCPCTPHATPRLRAAVTTALRYVLGMPNTTHTHTHRATSVACGYGVAGVLGLSSLRLLQRLPSLARPPAWYVHLHRRSVSPPHRTLTLNPQQRAMLGIGKGRAAAVAAADNVAATPPPPKPTPSPLAPPKARVDTCENRHMTLATTANPGDPCQHHASSGRRHHSPDW